MSFRWATLIVAAIQVAVLGLMANASASEDKYAQAMVATSEKYSVNIKGVFAGSCSWCHDGYGMDGGKGPKLAGTTKSIKEIVERISKGKSGYMPGFQKALGQEKIEALAEYIKMLPSEE